jgi:hypothetical protein
MASKNNNMVDYLFDISENVGDAIKVVYLFSVSIVLGLITSPEILPGYNSDGTALFDMSSQFIAFGGTSFSWAAALSVLAALLGLVMTQGLEFFSPQRVRDAGGLEEVLEWVAGVATVGVPALIALDMAGINSTITGDLMVALGVFVIHFAAIFYLVDEDRYN